MVCASAFTIGIAWHPSFMYSGNKMRKRQLLRECRFQSARRNVSPTVVATRRVPFANLQCSRVRANRCLVYELSISANLRDFHVKIPHTQVSSDPWRCFMNGTCEDRLRRQHVSCRQGFIWTESRQDPNQTTVPFIQSYSILKFDYKDTWAIIGCKIPDGDEAGWWWEDWTMERPKKLKINLNVRHWKQVTWCDWLSFFFSLRTLILIIQRGIFLENT